MANDPRLGRVFEPDPRNALFPVRAMLPRLAYDRPRTKIWKCFRILDQGQEGSCVGHGFAGEMLTRPFPDKSITHKDAVKIYKKAQTLDEYPGENYEGTSVLAGLKALQVLYTGVESYRWATSLNDVIAAVGYIGPVVIGVNWYESMFSPNDSNFLDVSGEISGGHCVFMRGVDITKKAFLIQNSWGRKWGAAGCAWISFYNFSRLLSEQGEACVIVHKAWWKRTVSFTF